VKQLLKRYRYAIILLRQLVKTDFKLRYQNSVLGYLWSLLKPFALFLILYVVFVKFIGVGTGMPHFPVYLLLGVVLWSYFTEVTGGSVAAIVGRGDLMRKISFPRYVVVVSGSLSALINLALNMTIVLIFAFFDKVDFGPSALFMPLIIFELFVFAIALAFFLSAAFVRFRDINHIWDVVLQGAFYATPILYLIGSIPPKAAKILMLNPVAQIIQDARYSLVTHNAQTINDIYGNSYMRVVPIGVALLILILSTRFFRKRSGYFAEEV
jgi:ABC-2 type transport system permease protein